MKNNIIISLLIVFCAGPCAVAQEYTHYLLAYFTGNRVDQEQIHYAISADATNFQALNHGAPIIASSTISRSGGVRDPFIVRGEGDGYFYMCVTDMRSSQGWESNRGMTILRSRDLINWESHIFHFPTLFPQSWSDVTRVWAPEIIWDKEAGKYMIYYSLLSKSTTHDVLYYSYINFDEDPDKWTITEPAYLFCYQEGGIERATIDANIVVFNDEYYMFFKTEDSEKRIRLHHSATLTDWSKAGPANVAHNPGEAEEGACCFQLIGQQKWIFMSDLYGRSTATFRQRTTTDFKKFTAIGELKGVAPRHGSVIWLTEEETLRLTTWSELQALLGENEDLKSSDVYQNAVAAVLTGDAQTMQDALQAFYSYLQSPEFLSQVRNGNFDAGTSHWIGNGSAGGDMRNPCVEAFNCNFDFHQTLTGLENGFYKLTVQAFQRPYNNLSAYSNYINNKGKICTWIYMNDVQKEVKNVMAEPVEQPYTWGASYKNKNGTYTPDAQSSASEAFSMGMYENSLGVEVTDGTLKVGIKSSGSSNASRWSCWDNFRLEKTETLYVDEEETGVSLPAASVAGADAIYNVQGVRLPTLGHGVNIVRFKCADGKVMTRKVVR